MFRAYLPNQRTVKKHYFWQPPPRPFLSSSPFPTFSSTTTLSPIGLSNQPTHCLSAPLWLKMSPPLPARPDKGRKQSKYPRYHIRRCIHNIIQSTTNNFVVLAQFAPLFFPSRPCLRALHAHSDLKKREKKNPLWHGTQQIDPL